MSGADYVSRQAHPEDRLSLVRTRVLGNQLRELDRLLSIWLDALNSTLAGRDPAFIRLRNTPNKLCLIEARLGSESVAHLRLRAIGRIGACLHHCSGRIHDNRIHDDIALAHGPGWTAIGRHHGDDPALLRLTAETLTSIGLFYLQIAKGVSGNQPAAEASRAGSARRLPAFEHPAAYQ